MKTITLNDLLVVYLTIPICLLIATIDWLFLDSLIKSSTTADPHNLLWFGVIFGLPHVLAGNTLFLDQEYITHYNWRILAILPFCFLIPYSAYLFGGIICVIFLEYLASMFHWASQQVGILAFYTSKRINKNILLAWRFCLFTCISASFFKSVGSEFLSQYSINSFDGVIGSSLVFSTLLTCYIFKNSKGLKCRTYIASSLGAVAGMFGLSEMGYPFLGIACIRLPHDVNAFLFYINHNHQRNKNEVKNLFLKLLFLPKPLFAPVLILVSVGLAYYLNWVESLIVASVLSYFHYITESFVWKSVGPHRENLNVITS